MPTLEEQRAALEAERSAYPPFHAAYKRLTNKIGELDAAIRERDLTI